MLAVPRTPSVPKMRRAASGLVMRQGFLKSNFFVAGSRSLSIWNLEGEPVGSMFLRTSAHTSSARASVRIFACQWRTKIAASFFIFVEEQEFAEPAFE